jgi:hypothetical protein
MTGILNSKERLIDFIITKNGRNKIPKGELEFVYASLSDFNTFYEYDVRGDEKVASDASGRLYFEAASRFQDTVVPELLDGTELENFRSSKFIFSGNKIMSGTFHKDAVTYNNIVSGSELISLSDDILDDIKNNFNDLKILATDDLFSDSNDFNISKKELTFNAENIKSKHIDLQPSILESEYFSHLPNFKYLPPINEKSGVSEASQPLSEYDKFNSNSELDITELIDKLNKRQSGEVVFNETSKDNNLIIQIYEFSTNGNEKLSIIDYGKYSNLVTGENKTESKNVYFIGKIIRDDNGIEKFVNIFTIIATE